MLDKKQSKNIAPSQKKRAATILVTALVIAVVSFGIASFKKPERSVASYCKVYKTENAKLPHAGGDKYSAGIFTSSKNYPHSFAAAYSKLEQVSPDEIKTDVKTLKSVFEKIDSDPSQTLSASLSGLGAQSNVKAWTSKHCEY